MKKTNIQCIELRDVGSPIHCPFCGIKVASGGDEQNAEEWIVGSCDHLLFAALSGIGFEYRSSRFEAAVTEELAKKTDEERQDIGDDPDELAWLVPIDNSFMFVSIEGPPGEQRSCIGFAPTS
jgi:hypothetical protein